MARVVLVVAPNWLGDAVMALPALADVRRHFTAARLVVAARPAVAPLYSLVEGIDETVPQDRGRIADAHADVAILFPNSFGTAWLLRQAGVPERWGYATDLRRSILTRAIRRPRASMHQGRYYQHLVNELGIPNGPLEPQLHIPDAVAANARALLGGRGWDPGRALLVVAPGAAYGTAKRWLPDHFATLITLAVRQQHMQCVLVGSRGDLDTTRWVRDAAGPTLRDSIIDLTGETSLEALAGVMSLAAACVSNDSGAMHLAGAVGVPLAALFGPTRDRETSPLTRSGARADLLINPVWCRPCMLRECPIDHRCMKGLTPDRVFASVQALIGGAP